MVIVAREKVVTRVEETGALRSPQLHTVSSAAVDQDLGKKIKKNKAGVAQEGANLVEGVRVETAVGAPACPLVSPAAVDQDFYLKKGALNLEKVPEMNKAGVTQEEANLVEGVRVKTAVGARACPQVTLVAVDQALSQAAVDQDFYLKKGR